VQAKFVKFAWENQSRTIATFYFEPTSRYRYEAGQYAVIEVPHASPDSRGIARTMTLSSSPHETLLSFTIKIYATGGSTFKQKLLTLQPGETVTIFDALGDLVLPLDAAVPLVFVAGGVGIASYVGMVKWLLHNRDARTVSLFYAVSHESEQVLLKPFNEYAQVGKVRQQLHVSRKPYLRHEAAVDNTTVDTISHRLAASDILPQITADALLYISGPEVMVESIRSQLVTAGIPNQRIIYDYFEGYESV